MPGYYPLNLDVENKKCVVIGGGEVAERKVKTLLDFNASIVVISTSFTPGLVKLGKNGKIKLCKRKFRDKDINQALLVIAATDDKVVNERVSALAQKSKILVNVIDQPSLCSFIAPSVIKRGPLVVAISTSGLAPAFSKSLRLRLEKFITPKTGKIVANLGRERKKRLESASARA
ncbi:bifunctional precorrin-2 dehydrogenase/sirohydrochlorin ferrochelatase [Candidatus Saganbacteria bacterium]|nr:bifunctional precorrin-2 dehydrogenase/sirohydrochlorin ferrochelatase [Candidatus Saganbacteria bacterium]